MKDLKVYYVTDDGLPAINVKAELMIEIIAKYFNLELQGSGVEIGTGIRDVHYKKEKK